MRIELLIDDRIKNISDKDAIDILEYRDNGDTVTVADKELVVCIDDMYNKSLVLNDNYDMLTLKILEERDF